MDAPRSPWRRAFNAPLLTAAALLVLAGTLVLLLGSGNLAIGVGAGLLGFAAVVLLAGFFLAIGYGEDDERSSGRS
ncbi:MAG TPA: hypothetical protein PKD63_07970 [Solirubrobacteraceae bacterium]|nr:hypothetical protein [Solirubrobacteraceae bacterium]